MANTSAVANQGKGSNNYNELIFRAKTSGDWPVVFVTCNYVDPLGCYPDSNAGPYNFTAKTTHTVVLKVAGNVGKTLGTITVAVHTPDGATVPDGAFPISAYARVAGAWKLVAQVRSTNGPAHLRFRVPAPLRGKVGQVRVTAGGGSYEVVARTYRVRFG